MVAMPQACLLCHKHGAFMDKIFKVWEAVYLLMAYRTGDPRFSLFLMNDAGDKKRKYYFSFVNMTISHPTPSPQKDTRMKTKRKENI